MTMKDWSPKSISKVQKLVLNIFPSIDTSVCATSVREFNKAASHLTNTSVLCISEDLPFAHARFCGAEGIDQVYSLSTFKKRNFAKDYGLKITDGAFEGLLARAVIVADENGTITYSELVPEIGQEPNYEAALAAVESLNT
jgi:thiol peroxidase